MDSIIIAVFVAATWACVKHNPGFSSDFPTVEAVKSLFIVSGFILCVDLEIVLCAPSPPILACIKHFSEDIPRHSWGAYTPLLEGCGKALGICWF